MAQTIRKRAKKLPPAEAVHLEYKDGVHHIVGLGNIRVLLMPDGDGWFAQGLEIDYAAQGDTKEDAKKEFEDGLESMVQEHLRVHGHISKLLTVAPPEVWHLVSDRSLPLVGYTQVTHHHVVRVIRENTNYEGLAYLVAAQSAGTCQ
jgi:hypothetical protein